MKLWKHSAMKLKLTHSHKSTMSVNGKINIFLFHVFFLALSHMMMISGREIEILSNFVMIVWVYVQHELSNTFTANINFMLECFDSMFSSFYQVNNSSKRRRKKFMRKWSNCVLLHEILFKIHNEEQTTVSMSLSKGEYKKIKGKTSLIQLKIYVSKLYNLSSRRSWLDGSI